MVSSTVTDLITDCRSQIDDFNQESITDEQILSALNRAQKAAVRITARRLDTIFLDSVRVNTSTATLGADGITYELDMPVDVFGRRIEKVEVQQPGSQVLWRVKHISYKQRDPFVISSQVSVPYYYDVVGTKIRLYPNASPNNTLIIFYSRTPELLVKPQGQINSVNIANNYVIVDEVGPDLTTETDQRNSYVNFIDYKTGEVKASMQIAFLDPTSGQIKFKSSGLTRTSVFDKTIVTSIPSTVTPDDLICVVKGTAVSQLPDAYTDFLVQHTIVQLKRRLREDSAEEFAALKDIEENLKKMIMGREQSMRIRKVNSAFSNQPGGALRRFFS